MKVIADDTEGPNEMHDSKAASLSSSSCAGSRIDRKAIMLSHSRAGTDFPACIARASSLFILRKNSESPESFIYDSRWAANE